MSATHHHVREVCQHGFMVKQCRCPAPKTDRVVPCPDTPRHAEKLATLTVEVDGFDPKDAVL